ncbi:D-alanyl-D-alanine carboxypeptidase family protein [Xanthobacter sp. AM11]|uniref:D-alanyl-D-alanine carboxypeptidase family protein n=1 Tax=Xanthobacter sp. AM11 TaxID=3380643 RepID=UPI0039BFBFA8
MAFAVLAAFSFTATAADAKPRKKAQVERSKDRSKERSKSRTTTVARSGNDDGARWHYGSSAIMVDANTGKVLYEDNADALRHPASVTKIMTLYLLFEQLEEGNLKLDSDLEVSAKAAAQQPSKLGVRAGSSIEVEDAIKALVTRSANDVAVVIAENLAGSESEFAEAMTRKARALGMSRTVFRNASGLPNPSQVTTARDLAILGRAVQDRFPKQYKYFATRTFYYRGQAIGNHNRLLGRVEGVDGIKTGYTQASGFNLVTSVKRDGRYLVGVVLGGSSGGSRDARMASLISQTLPTAYAGMRTAPKVTEVAEAAIPVARQSAGITPVPVTVTREPDPPHAVAPLPKPAMAELASRQPPEPATTASIPPARATQAAAAQPQPKAGSAEPIRPVAVKTVSISRSTAAAAGAGFTTPSGVLGYLGPAGAAQSPAAAAAQAAAEGHARTAPRQVAALDPAPRPDAKAAADAREQAQRAARIAAMEPDDPYAQAAARARAQHEAAQARAQASAQAAARAAGEPVKPAPAPRPVRTASLAPVAVAEPAPPPAPASARSGWQIQIGAYGGEREARTRLDVAKTKAKAVLGRADAYTEKVVKGASELYRARFAGLDEKGAREACRLLKRNDFDCMTIRN